MAVDWDYFCRKLVADGLSVADAGPEGGVCIRCAFHSGGAAVATLDGPAGTVRALSVYFDDADRYPTPDALSGFLNWICCVWHDAAGEPAPKCDASCPTTHPENPANPA